MAKAFRPAYPTLRDGAVTRVGIAHYADTVFRDGHVDVRITGHPTLGGKPDYTMDADDPDRHAVIAREAAADFYG